MRPDLARHYVYLGVARLQPEATVAVHGALAALLVGRDEKGREQFAKGDTNGAPRHVTSRGVAGYHSTLTAPPRAPARRVLTAARRYDWGW